MGSVPSLSGHATAYRWRSLPIVRRHRASKPLGSSSNGCCLCITMDQLICASLSHTHSWYEVGMLQVSAISYIHANVLPRALQHRASKPQGSSSNGGCLCITMDQLICASLSHTHSWYEVGMLKVSAISYIHTNILPRVRRYRASSPQGSSSNGCSLCITMDQLICASLSHIHYWYEVGMLKVSAISYIHTNMSQRD